MHGQVQVVCDKKKDALIPFFYALALFIWSSKQYVFYVVPRIYLKIRYVDQIRGDAKQRILAID